MPLVRDTIADDAVLMTYPLPWQVIAESSCTRIVAANGATVLACSTGETDIAHCIVRMMNILASNLVSGKDA